MDAILYIFMSWFRVAIYLRSLTESLLPKKGSWDPISEKIELSLKSSKTPTHGSRENQTF
jgi:hypothetical protein